LFAGVLLLLLVIVLLHSRLTFIGGLPIELPEGPRLPGVTNATVTVAVDERGQLYYLNQMTSLEDLERGLARAVRSADGPLTLVLLADRRVSQETLVRLMNAGRVAGVKNALLATRPTSGGGRP
jgi:biopolymer transport protein ExbD